MTFLDTSIVVELLRGRNPGLRDRYNAERSAGSPLAISTVVLFELRFGAENSERPEQNLRMLAAFLEEAVSLIAFDEAAATEAGSIRAELSRIGSLIGPYDILIAAQARSAGAALVTGNTREFARVPGLLAIDWAS